MWAEFSLPVVGAGMDFSHALADSVKDLKASYHSFAP